MYLGLLHTQQRLESTHSNGAGFTEKSDLSEVGRNPGAHRVMLKSHTVTFCVGNYTTPAQAKHHNTQAMVIHCMHTKFQHWHMLLFVMSHNESVKFKGSKVYMYFNP